MANVLKLPQMGKSVYKNVMIAQTSNGRSTGLQGMGEGMGRGDTSTIKQKRSVLKQESVVVRGNTLRLINVDTENIRYGIMIREVDDFTTESLVSIWASLLAIRKQVEHCFHLLRKVLEGRAKNHRGGHPPRFHP